MAEFNNVLLFRTIHKTKPNSPDMHGRGHIKVADKLYEVTLAAWAKRSDRAGDFYSVDITVGREPLPDAMNTAKEDR